MSAIIILLIEWNRIETLYPDNYFLRRGLFCYVYLPSFIPSKERRRSILEYSDKNNVEYRFINRRLINWHTIISTFLSTTSTTLANYRSPPTFALESPRGTSYFQRARDCSVSFRIQRVEKRLSRIRGLKLVGHLIPKIDFFLLGDGREREREIFRYSFFHYIYRLLIILVIICLVVNGFM